MDRKRAHRLFVVSERSHAFASCEIPEPECQLASERDENILDGRVHTSSDNLGFGFLADDRGNGTGVSGKCEDLSAGTHVPYLSSALCDRIDLLLHMHHDPW